MVLWEGKGKVQSNLWKRHDNIDLLCIIQFGRYSRRKLRDGRILGTFNVQSGLVAHERKNMRKTTSARQIYRNFIKNDMHELDTI